MRAYHKSKIGKAGADLSFNLVIYLSREFMPVSSLKRISVIYRKGS